LSGCDFFAEVEVRRAEGEGGVIPIKICRPKVTEMQDPPSHGDRSAGIRRFSVGSKNAFEKMNTTLLGGQVIANVDLPWETPLPAKLSGIVFDLPCVSAWTVCRLRSLLTALTNRR
jgi:hypothetical protein